MSPRADRSGDAPLVPTRLVASSLPPDHRGRSILGDLLEEWHARTPGPARTLWYWSECIRVAVRYAFVRRRLPGVRPDAGRSRSPGFLDGLRHGVRRALRAPLSSSLTVLALGLGVAAPTLMYSIAAGVTQDLPVPEPDALVQIGRRFTPSIIRGAPPAWVRPFLERAGAADAELERLGGFSLEHWDLSDGSGPAERRRGARITPGVFPTLRVAPALGRAIGEADATGDAAPVVVISDDLWRERFGSDRDVLGREIRVDGVPHTVIGVMPPRFAFPEDVELWVPLDPASAGIPWVELVGRLRRGGSLEELAERVALVGAGLREAGTVSADVPAPLGAGPWSERAVDREGRIMLDLMVLLVSFVLVIACADVMHLFLARALAQGRDTVVRVSLGASRWRVAASQMADALLLSLTGGLLGVGIAATGARLVEAAMAPRLAWWMSIRLEPSVLLFVVVLVALSALVTGLVPALHATRLDVAAGLRVAGRTVSGGRSISRLTGALVVGEVALSCALLVVSGLLIRGAIRSLPEEGWARASVLVAAYELPPERYPGEEAVAFHRELLERLADRPGTEAVALVSDLPGIASESGAFEVEGTVYERPEDRPTTHVLHASPGFLDALDARPLLGRDLTWSDGREAPLAVLVNEPFVRRHLAGREALGSRLRLAPADGADEAAAAPAWATIVGVVPSFGLRTGHDPDDAGIYFPIGATGTRDPWVLVRASGGVTPESLAPAVRSVAAALDPDLALFEMRSLDASIRADQDMEHLFARLFLFFGASGLVLAGVGLYGLMVFTVGRRLRELGIRAALGARPRAIVWSAVRGGTFQVGVGVVLGLTLAWVVAPLLGELFMGYDPRDPVSYGAVALVLVLTGVAAALTPARRALALDVSAVLRAD